MQDKNKARHLHYIYIKNTAFTLDNITTLRISDDQLADMGKIAESLSISEQKRVTRAAAIRYCLELGRAKALEELSTPALPGVQISRHCITKRDLTRLAQVLVGLGYDSLLSPTQPVQK